MHDEAGSQIGPINFVSGAGWDAGDSIAAKPFSAFAFLA